jgi:hypothetical protein
VYSSASVILYLSATTYNASLPSSTLAVSQSDTSPFFNIVQGVVASSSSEQTIVAVAFLARHTSTLEMLSEDFLSRESVNFVLAPSLDCFEIDTTAFSNLFLNVLELNGLSLIFRVSNVTVPAYSESNSTLIATQSESTSLFSDAEQEPAEQSRVSLVPSTYRLASPS